MTKFDAETSVEAGRLGGAAKVKKEAVRGKGLAYLKDREDELIQELVRAALGHGKWKDFPAEKRMGALRLSLEYRFGKPRMRDAGDTADDNTEEDTFSFETAGEANKA